MDWLSMSIAAIDSEKVSVIHIAAENLSWASSIKCMLRYHVFLVPNKSVESADFG